MDYTIGKRQRTTFIDETGHAVDGYRVFYTMGDGTVDYVEVEKNRYSAENVKAAIEADIETHLAIIGS